MSAYLVSNYEVNALATFAVVHGLVKLEPGATPAQLARALWAENVASLDARYPADAAKNAEALAGFAYEPVVIFNPWAMIKASVHYDYQSCEHDGWMASYSKKVADLIFVKACELADAPKHHAHIRERHEYQHAPWGLEAG